MNASYLRFAGRRLAQAVVVVLLAYVFTFVVISVLPGDPVTNTLRNPENGFTEEEIQRIVAYYGLDQPVAVQLWQSLSHFVVGDLGVSLRSNLPVDRLVAEVVPSTLALAASALAVALVLAFAIAYGTQALPRRYGQGLLRAFPSLFLSVPGFVVGLLLIQVFAFQLGLFRVIEPDSAWATFFAAVALGIPVSAQVAEVLITGLDHESHQEYAAVARSRGLGQTRLFAWHLLKPSSLPVVTVVALTVGELLGGALITETIFGRTGVGSLVQRSVSTQDLPVLQAVVSLAAVVFVVVNLLADLVYPLLDPRVRPEAAAAPREAAPEAPERSDAGEAGERLMTAATVVGSWRADAARAWPRAVPPTVLLSFAVLLVVLLWSLLPGVFASQDPVNGVPADKLLGPSADHWFGTDHLGRDLFSRVVHGTASSVASALVAVTIGVVVGGAIGLVAGSAGGWADVVLARIVDVLLAIPSFLLAVVIVSALGFETVNAAIATGVSAVAVFARVMRAEVIKTRRAVFVEAAVLQGGSRTHVLLRHVLPNASRSLLALAVLQFGLSILVIAGLAFLGYGDPPPASDWGLLVSSGKDYPTAPWLVYAPALVVVATVLSVNRVSRWLRRTD